ncbi:DUF5667 domain-containing protein [Neobacillus pocheonensis]|uniref:DUF5667 domain-containing protein n=1 Tax=Neobacillus pocheonensis TaxID=363869 RepID=UPI003D29A371
MKTKKMTHLLTSGMVASSLIFSIGAGSAFANGDGSDSSTESAVTTDQAQNGADQTVETSDQVENSGEQTETTAEDTTIQDEVAGDTEEVEQADTDEVEKTETEQADTDAAVQTDKVEAPSLVPGDFFYFVKTMTEKIRLAFTVDDYKEAKLLAEFAAERIAEANVLFKDGKTEEAASLLKEAIATQEQSSENLPATEDVSSDDTQSDEVAVQSKLAHNIDALCAALAHVKNPTAQQAIMKNIQKSFAKLEKKAAKLEEKDAKFAEKMSKIEEKVASGDISEDKATHAKNKLEKKQKQKHEEAAAEVEKVEQETTTQAAQELANEQQAVVETTKVANNAVEKQKDAAQRVQQKATKAQSKPQAAAKKVEEKKQNNEEKQHGEGNGNSKH